VVTQSETNYSDKKLFESGIPLQIPRGLSWDRNKASAMRILAAVEDVTLKPISATEQVQSGCRFFHYSNAIRVWRVSDEKLQMPAYLRNKKKTITINYMQ
jgi:hypothetical protein